MLREYRRVRSIQKYYNKMKIKLLIFALLALVFTACDKNDENIQTPSTTNKDVCYLKFENNDNLLEYLKSFKSTNDTINTTISKVKRHNFNVTIPTGFQSINQISEGDRVSEMSKINKSNSSESGEIEDMSIDEYNIMVAKNLLQDPILYNAMDTTLRIGVGGYLYKITNDGTFFAPYSRENELMEKIKEFSQIKENLAIVDNSQTYDLGQEVKFIYSFANSPIANNQVADKEEITLNKVKSRYNAISSDSEYISRYGLVSEKWGSAWYTFPVWQWLFGKDESVHQSFANNKRLSVELFNVNYGFYTSAGLKVKFQKKKKFLFVSYWVNTPADKIAIGFEKFDAVMTYNAPPSNINPLYDKAYGAFASTFNGMAGNILYTGYHKIDFIEDWVDNIMSFVPNVQVFGTTYPTAEQIQKLYNTPADMIYSELKKLSGQYIFNPIKKQIKTDDPRIAYLEWGSANIPIKTFVRGVQEYSDIESKTIRFNQSGGFYFFNGAVSGYLPSTIAIKDIDVFAAANVGGVWKGVRFYK